MKSLKQHIFEKLKVSGRNTTKHTLFPETREELDEMIRNELSAKGYICSLNHIDVSRITDMHELFRNFDFNGIISEWDVSNVTDMHEMFAYSKFNGNISNWDVSNVSNMGDMFKNNPLQNNPPKWYKA